MAGNKNSCLVLAIVLGVVPLLALGGAGAFVYFTYIKQRSLIISEVESLPVFDTEKMSSEIALEYNFQLPVKAPAITQEVLNKKIKAAVQKKAKEKFPPKVYSAQFIAIMQKYSMAREGKEITFQLIPRADQGSGDVIKGIYKGVFNSSSGKVVGVDNKKYPFFSIAPECKYLFDEGLCKVLQEEKIKEFKTKFENDEKEYMNSLADEYEKKLFVTAGYSKDKEGKWLPNSEILKEELDKRKAVFKKERTKNMAEIRKKHKVFGIYEIEQSEISKYITNEDSLAPEASSATAKDNKEKADKK